MSVFLKQDTHGLIHEDMLDRISEGKPLCFIYFICKNSFHQLNICLNERGYVPRQHSSLRKHVAMREAETAGQRCCGLSLALVILEANFVFFGAPGPQTRWIELFLLAPEWPLCHCP